jgi:serine/threonine protein phosphatase PrpC
MGNVSNLDDLKNFYRTGGAAATQSEPVKEEAVKVEPVKVEAEKPQGESEAQGGSESETDTVSDEGSNEEDIANKKREKIQDESKHLLKQLKLSVSAHSEIGGRDSQEDFYSYGSVGGNSVYCGVYDGHNGPDAARFAGLKMHKRISEQFDDKNWSEIETIMRNSFVKIDEQFRETAASDGATATVVLINEKYETIVSNVGDSHCVWVKNAKRAAKHEGEASDEHVKVLTKEHKPSDPDEAKRIKKAGHDVENVVDLIDGKRVKTARVDGELAVSRALGDDSFKDTELEPENNAVSAVPSSTVIQFDRDDCLVIASDGLWDVLKPNELIRFVNAKNSAEKLVKLAIERGSQDNVTVIVVRRK